MQADGFGLVGTTIAEKYVVEAVADTGGTAIVYRAFHLPWKRAVALKVFRTPAYVDEASRAALLERFVLEGRILGELSERSSAVLQVCDIGTLTTSSGEWSSVVAHRLPPYFWISWCSPSTSSNAAVGISKSRALARPLAPIGPSSGKRNKAP